MSLDATCCVCTGTTVELIGLGHLASGESGQVTATISKEDLLKDIQFRSVTLTPVSCSLLA